MSLRGRYIIDRIKRVVSSHLKMPVPPYGEPQFWDNVYQKMETASVNSINQQTGQLDFDDAFEWGGVTLTENLMPSYSYKDVTINLNDTADDYSRSSLVGDAIHETTFGRTIGVEPTSTSSPSILKGGEQDGEEAAKGEEPILMLGCGNSKMGEEMVEYGWNGPIIQVDIAKTALEMIERRTLQMPSNLASKLRFVQDDATHLKTLENDTMKATIDKGLIDALFCADEYEQLSEILNSVLRVLQPGGVFCIFSRSRPEFLLPQLFPVKSVSALQPGKPTWQGLQMQQVQSMLLYRFQKQKSPLIEEPKRINKKKKQRRQ